MNFNSFAEREGLFHEHPNKGGLKLEIKYFDEFFLNI
jgi:hypothetical protein